jgi:hypothetical protein
LLFCNLYYITNTRATRTTTTITKVSIKANPSIARMKNKPPSSGAYASALSKAAKISPTPTAHPPKGRDSKPKAKHFKALRKITIQLKNQNIIKPIPYGVIAYIIKLTDYTNTSTIVYTVTCVLKVNKFFCCWYLIVYRDATSDTRIIHISVMWHPTSIVIKLIKLNSLINIIRKIV